MRVLHCTCALLGILAAPLLGQPAQPQAGRTAGYTVFVRGVPSGHEDVSVAISGEGTTITSEGRTSQPGNAVTQRAEFQYDERGTPESFALEGTVNGNEIALRTTFKEGVALTEGTRQGTAVSFTENVSPGSVMLPTGLFAGFAALPARLEAVKPGDTFPVFVVPADEVTARVASVSDERMQIGTDVLDVRRHEIVLAEAAGDLTIHVTTAAGGNLVRVNVPAQGIDFVRDDLSAATSRIDVYSNPTDEAVLIPAPGFNLVATLTIPAAAAAGGVKAASRLPAVVMVTPRDAPGRDLMAPGVPGIAQLAGAIADAGFIVVRYDNRGAGQSGGRAESATLSDYAEDVRAVVRWLANRKDVDSKRIGVVGYAEGAWVAMLAASREDRVSALVTLAAPASNGLDLALEQQQLELEALKLPESERTTKVALQKQILDAVISGKGWNELPPELRRQADTPYFQSVLQFNPAKTIDNVDAPILIVHGELDREVPVAHAERLAGFAQKGDSEAVELLTVKGVNHHFSPAFTGEVSEYSTLSERQVTQDVTAAVAGWLTKSLPARERR